MTALEKRYEKALRDIGTATLLNLPGPIKKLLKKTTDLETKVELLEKIEAELKEGGTA